MLWNIDKVIEQLKHTLHGSIMFCCKLDAVNDIQVFPCSSLKLYEHFMQEKSVDVYQLISKK